eukprot:TRINITY_DN1244_c1_g1_i1.p1 TRINITY_DN1244_c1_g1~~TRINITY_DN1244_c1_g1_i1.p1  ORF type:complete len:229 (-),score=14.62 TRINITY_DN1244_c1_g1_i1:606-1292(-)
MRPIVLHFPSNVDSEAARSQLAERVKSLVMPIQAINSQGNPCRMFNGVLYLGGGQRSGNYVISVAHMLKDEEGVTYRAVVDGQTINLIEVKRGINSSSGFQVDAVVFQCQEALPGLPAPMPICDGVVGRWAYVLAHRGDSTHELARGRITSYGRYEGTVALEVDPCCAGAPAVTREGLLLGLMLRDRCAVNLNKGAAFVAAPVINTFITWPEPQLQGFPVFKWGEEWW